MSTRIIGIAAILACTAATSPAVAGPTWEKKRDEAVSLLAPNMHRLAPLGRQTTPRYLEMIKDRGNKLSVRHPRKGGAIVRVTDPRTRDQLVFSTTPGGQLSHWSMDMVRTPDPRQKQLDRAVDFLASAEKRGNLYWNDRALMVRSIWKMSRSSDQPSHYQRLTTARKNGGISGVGISGSVRGTEVVASARQHKNGLVYYHRTGDEFTSRRSKKIAGGNLWILVDGKVGMGKTSERVLFYTDRYSDPIPVPLSGKAALTKSWRYFAKLRREAAKSSNEASAAPVK